jgi:hypothetical protein
MTEAERRAIEASRIELQAHWDCVHEKLRLDAQACSGSMGSSLLLADPVNAQAFEDDALQALADYRLGQALMEQLGAGRLLNPVMTGSAHECHSDPSFASLTRARYALSLAIPLMPSPSFYEICCGCFGINHLASLKPRVRDALN